MQYIVQFLNGLNFLIFLNLKAFINVLIEGWMELGIGLKKLCQPLTELFVIRVKSLNNHSKRLLKIKRLYCRMYNMVF